LVLIVKELEVMSFIFRNKNKNNNFKIGRKGDFKGFKVILGWVREFMNLGLFV
jgi:hypothetical protein